MPESDLEDTRPRRVRPEDTQPRHTSKISGTLALDRPKKRLPLSGKSRRWLGTLLVALLISAAVVSGALAGHLSARQVQARTSASQEEQSLEEQFELGIQDFQGGRYEVARQRFEYILSQNPAYPGAADELAKVFSVLYATSAPTMEPPTITPTPTQDLRPVQDLFLSGQSLFNAQDWNGAIDTLLALRKIDPAYQVTGVDRLLYLSLRSRGIAKILQEANLAGGIYDLALAARFAPLDTEAANAREWARLYLVGLSFWEVHPEQAVFYFSQVAAAVPGLRDGSGITANERYRQSLIQYGDLLASQKSYCEAQSQYQLALAITADAAVEEKLKTVAELCSPSSPTPGSITPSFTPTSSATLPAGVTPSATAPATPTPTFTQSVQLTTTVPPSDTPALPSNTPAPPSDTPAPPTDTPPPAVLEPSATTRPGKPAPADSSSGAAVAAQAVRLAAWFTVNNTLLLFWWALWRGNQ